MKYRVLKILLILFACSRLSFAEQINPPPLFVSLGCYCTIAEQLRANNLRTTAYPFDWLLSEDNDKFIQILDEDFYFYTDENFFIQGPGDGAVTNTKYDIKFMHDWPFQNNETSPERELQHIRYIQEKYDRRINRFRLLREYKGKVIFIRTLWPNSLQKNYVKFYNRKISNLKNALDRYFPELDFELVIVCFKKQCTPKFKQIDRVKEFIIDNRHIDRDFKDMFETLLNTSQH